VRLCGEFVCLTKGQSRGGVQRKHPLRPLKKSVGKEGGLGKEDMPYDHHDEDESKPDGINMRRHQPSHHSERSIYHDHHLHLDSLQLLAQDVTLQLKSCIQLLVLVLVQDGSLLSNQLLRQMYANRSVS
jgi:hypothetical protein